MANIMYPSTYKTSGTNNNAPRQCLEHRRDANPTAYKEACRG